MAQNVKILQEMLERRDGAQGVVTLVESRLEGCGSLPRSKKAAMDRTKK